jgi:hypothetical protein
VSRIAGLGTTAAAAYAGIRNANARLSGAAETISRAGTPAADTVTISAAARAGRASEGDLVSALTDLTAAPHQSAAAVAVLRTLDQVSEDLLDSVGGRK